MNTKEDAMINKVIEVYDRLRADKTFSKISENELIDHAVKIVSTTQITTRLQAIDKSLEYIN